MGATHRFLADPNHPEELLSWFRGLAHPPVEIQTASSLVLHFTSIGSLAQGTNGTIEPKASPVATVFLPQVRRGVLWTVGEVHFLATPLRTRWPELHQISQSFRSWLSSHECIYSAKKQVHAYDYYLEGSIRNYDSDVFALPSGRTALLEGRYFVSEDDNEHRLQLLCQSLRLRGLRCGDA